MRDQPRALIPPPRSIYTTKCCAFEAPTSDPCRVPQIATWAECRRGGKPDGRESDSRENEFVCVSHATGTTMVEAVPSRLLEVELSIATTRHLMLMNWDGRALLCQRHRLERRLCRLLGRWRSKRCSSAFLHLRRLSRARRRARLQRAMQVDGHPPAPLRPHTSHAPPPDARTAPQALRKEDGAMSRRRGP